MVVDDVRPDGHVHGDRYTAQVGLGEDAVTGIRRPGVREIAAERLPDPQAARNPVADGLVDLLAGFLGHPEGSLIELALHILAGGADQGDLEVVNDARPVQRDAADETAVHEVDHDGGKAGLDHVPTHSPQHRFPGRERRGNGVGQVAQALGREDSRQPFEKLGNRSPLGVRSPEAADVDLAGPVLQRIRPDPRSIKRPNRILGHALSITHRGRTWESLSETRTKRKNYLASGSYLRFSALFFAFRDRGGSTRPGILPNLGIP